MLYSPVRPSRNKQPITKKPTINDNKRAGLGTMVRLFCSFVRVSLGTIVKLFLCNLGD